MNDNIFTLKETAALLKVTENTISRLLSSKKLEHFKISGKIRVSQTQLNSYLDSVKVLIA